MNDAGDAPDADADPAGAVRAASEELAAAEAAVADRGEARLAAVREAYREATDLLDRYEGRATGTGDFAAFVEFQEAFVELVEGLDADLPAREAFERANDLLDQRRLGEDDFAAARDELSAAAELVALLDDRETARERYEATRRDARRRLRELSERIDRLERLQRLGEADLDAPVERLRDPIDAYDDAVREAWREFRREASAREVFRVVEASGAYPLAAFRQPPSELREYVATAPAGEEPIPTLLEYADYSPSKLDHYVDDVGALRTTVAVHRTYLERLDAEPLTIDWPPPAAGTLERRAEELVSLVGRFADEATVATLRAVRDLPRETDYERLRTAARSREDLGEAERERVQSGDLDRELERARSLLTDLEDAIDG